mgnify:CR=1 FL=1
MPDYSTILTNLATLIKDNPKLAGTTVQKAIEFGLSPQGRLVLAAGKQGVNYLKAQGGGPQANRPSHYTIGKKGMRVLKHGGEVGSEGNPVPVDGRVQKDEQGRDFVMFQDSEGGEAYPVYSENYGWNEVEGSMEGGAQVIRMDVNYPVMRDESGGYSLDASAYESMISGTQKGNQKPDVNALLQMLESQGSVGQ